MSLAKGKVDTALQMSRDVARVAPRDANVQLTLARSLLAKRQVRRGRSDRAAPRCGPARGCGCALARRERRAGQTRSAGSAASRSRKAHELAPADIEPVAGLVTAGLCPEAARRRRAGAWSPAPPIPHAASTRMLLGARVYVAPGDRRRPRPLLKTRDRGPSRCAGTLRPARPAVRRRRDAWPRRGELRANARAHSPTQWRRTPSWRVLYEMEGNRSRGAEAVRASPADRQHAPPWRPTTLPTSTRRRAAISMSRCNSPRRPSRSCRDAPEMTDTVGWVYYKKELPGLAIPMFEQAVAKDPAEPDLSIPSGARALEESATRPRRARRSNWW